MSTSWFLLTYDLAGDHTAAKEFLIENGWVNSQFPSTTLAREYTGTSTASGVAAAVKQLLLAGGYRPTRVAVAKLSDFAQL